jgi:hypothetical protein
MINNTGCLQQNVWFYRILKKYEIEIWPNCWQISIQNSKSIQKIQYTSTWTPLGLPNGDPWSSIKI